MTQYIAYIVPDQIRTALAEAFPPKFPDFIGHHVSLCMGSTPPEGFEIGQMDTITVVGYVCDESLEALVVKVSGSPKRPDGRTFHITWSLDREQKRKPMHSNDVIRNNTVETVASCVFKAILTEC